MRNSTEIQNRKFESFPDFRRGTIALERMHVSMYYLSMKIGDVCFKILMCFKILCDGSTLSCHELRDGHNNSPLMSS